MGRLAPCPPQGCQPRSHWSRVLACLELALWAAAFVHLSAWTRLLHFTWWGILFHAATLAAFLVHPPSADFHADVCVQAVVITGVIYMSLCGCDMLVDAHNSMGTAAYAAGNFFIHYLPLLSAFSRVSRTSPAPTAVSLWLVYNTVAVSSHHPPNETYGCDAPSPLVLTTGTFAALAATLLPP